jgi:phage terminase large subunit-like protein
MPNRSLAERLADLPADAQDQILSELGDAKLAALQRCWEFWARPAQLAPAGAWRTWIIMAGRGFGKTRAGAEWVRMQALAQADLRIALVAATLQDARAVMVEGPSGLLATVYQRPQFLASKREVRWPNGACARIYSAEEPDALRGPEHHIAWCDELAKWTHAQDSWDMLQLSLRLGELPQALVTTTPRPIAVLRKLLATSNTVVTRGRTSDNRAYLPAAYLAEIEATYGGTRLGRQELDGEILDDTPGALWTHASLDATRVAQTPDLTRCVVAIDPPVSSGETADACGIIVAARAADDHYYVLADRTLQGASPAGWARAALKAWRDFNADRLVAEVNNGGALVETLLRSIEPNVAYRAVRASRGKVARAEPIAALYERGLVHHVGGFPDLEDELCALTPGAVYSGPNRSPDRADALVWALTDLMTHKSAAPIVRALK